MSQAIRFERTGPLSCMTLNRPEALNALTLAMIHTLHRELTAAESDDRVHAMVIRAVPGRAFCAGGDIRWLYDTGSKTPMDTLPFFWDEYQLNAAIHHTRKPWIALMDGITMGGGVGISLHGAFPIATENFLFAMPETGIGFFPDIGASWHLARLPGAIGMYLALTGNRLGAKEASMAGLVHHVVESASIPALMEALEAADWSRQPSETVDNVISGFHTEVSGEWPERELIARCFSGDSIESVFRNLEHEQDPFAGKILETLHAKSPLALAVTFEQICRARHCTLRQCLAMDFRLVSHFMHSHDFYEGVRALLVDKDKRPVWHPGMLSEVSRTQTEGFFAQMAHVPEWQESGAFLSSACV